MPRELRADFALLKLKSLAWLRENARNRIEPNDGVERVGYMTIGVERVGCVKSQ